MHDSKRNINGLPLDIIDEILGHLSLFDIARVRQVSRRFFQAGRQQSVWSKLYNRSCLLLPDTPTSSQTASQLEAILIRASRTKWNWTSPKPMMFSSRRFPVDLPTYSFIAHIINGRYLQLCVAEGIRWYDLDSGDISTPILRHPYPETDNPTNPTQALYQTNANGEGRDALWVVIVYPSSLQIIILKVRLGETHCHASVHALIPMVAHLTSLKLDHDWLLPIQEFSSPDDPMELIHIPSGVILRVPMHGNVQSLAHLNNLHCIIASGHLFLMFAERTETLVEVYSLPRISSTTQDSQRPLLIKSHTATYPHPMCNVQIAEEPSSSSSSTLSDAPPSPVRVTFLSLVYVNRGRPGWTARIGLHLIDADIDPFGVFTFATRCERVLDVGLPATTLLFTSRRGVCLAVTYSSPGPVLLAHHIQRLSDSSVVMNVKQLNLPEGVQAREILGFDGYRGRLCLISGWTKIEIVDYE